MLIGYARVSTSEQTVALQRDALTAAGCEVIFTDEGVSGARTKRPGLSKALKAAKPGDTLVIWKLDRLGRSLSDLVQLATKLRADNVQLRSLTEGIDPATPIGRAMFGFMATLAEFDRSLIIERTKAGLEAAKRRGQKLGRKPSLTGIQVRYARQLIEGGQSPRTVAASFGCARSTLYLALKTAADAK